MALTQPQFNEFYHCVLDAYDQASLERMLRLQLGKRLHLIVQVGSFQDTVLRLLEVAQREGWDLDLVEAAHNGNPTNRRLAEFAASLSNRAERLPHDRSVTTDGAPPRWVVQRLRDLQRHIEQDQLLLAAYEDQLRGEDDPRRLLKIKGEIDRQQQSVAHYRRQYDQFVQQTPEAALAVDANAALVQALRAVQAQMTGMEQRLSVKLDAQAHLLAQLTAGQRETVDDLTALVDAHQLAQLQADEITRLVQLALVKLQRAPNAAYWEELQQAVAAQSSVDGKLKLMIPIIPTVLEYETELTRDLLPDLQRLWAWLRRRVQGGAGRGA